jgi:ribonucleoside-diphosphate reductase alpha chain
MGIHEWLLQRGYKYEMVPELRQWLEVYREESERAANSLCDRLSVSRPVAYRAIAPTGTIGILAGTTTGIEPLFAVAYKRRYLTGGTQWKYEYVVDSTAEAIIQQTGIDPNEIETSMSLANDFERRIAFQADVQDYVDMAISSTINVPSWGSELNNEDKVTEFAGILAQYAPRLRGFTVYPDGSRGGQPITTVSYKEAKKHKGVVFEENGDNQCSSGVCGI